MSGAGVGMAAAGTVMSAIGKINEGKAYAALGTAQQQQQNYEASLLQQQAGQDRAAAQQRLQGQLINMNLALSRARALSSYAGGASTDPTVVNQVLGPLRAQGEYKAMKEIYTGEERARGEETQASLDQYMGREAYAAGQYRKSAANFSAVTGLLSRGSTLASKYGSGSGGLS